MQIVGNVACELLVGQRQSREKLKADCWHVAGVQLCVPPFCCGSFAVHVWTAYSWLVGSLLQVQILET